MQHGRRELTVVSDFQAGTLDSIDLRAVPPGVAVHFERVPATTPPSVIDTSRARVGVSIRVPPSKQSAANAVLSTAPAVTADAAGIQVVVAYKGAAGTAELVREAQRIADPRFASAMVRLDRDALLRQSLAAVQSPAPNRDARFTPVADARGTVLAAQIASNSGLRLLLVPSFDVATLASAALIGATSRAFFPEPPSNELDPALISDDELAQWSRVQPDGEANVAPSSLDSDGRWLWGVVLLLLILETVLRRVRVKSSTANVVHAG
jgi:hypothetical protein